MIKTAKQRGFITTDELNKILPSEEFTSEQIEDTLSMLSEMGINVVENEEDAESAEEKDGEGGTDRPRRYDSVRRQHQGRRRPHR